MAFPLLPFKPAPARPPVADSVCIFGEEHVFTYDTVFVAKQKHWTMADEWIITDLEGTEHYKVKDKIFEIRDKKTLVNALGTPVCTAIEKMMTMHATTLICKGGEKNIDKFEVKARKKIRTHFDKMEVFFKSNNTEDPDLVVYGKFLQWDFQVYSRNRNVLAEVTYDPFSSKGWYTVKVKVKAGMDVALALMLMVISFEIMMPPPPENKSAGVGDLAIDLGGLSFS